MNCSNNTVGNFCEECEDGFFGDASSGGSCQACMCNHPLGSNSIVCDKVELPHVSKAVLMPIMCAYRCLVIVRAMLDLSAESVTPAETASMIRLTAVGVRLNCQRTLYILKNGFSLQLLWSRNRSEGPMQLDNR